MFVVEYRKPLHALVGEERRQFLEEMGHQKVNNLGIKECEISQQHSDDRWQDEWLYCFAKVLNNSITFSSYWNSHILTNSIKQSLINYILELENK